jgi:hypothetical protein
MRGYKRYLVACIIITSASIARADDQATPHHFFSRFHQNKAGTPPPGKPRFIPHTDLRAGHPRDFAGHLEESATCGGIGYYVGGGVKWGHGEGRTVHDGTWGWDETGCRR